MSSKTAAARRKSDNGSGGGGASGGSTEPEPTTVAAGRAFLGRRVEKVFMDEALGKARPYGGEVVDVMTSISRPGGGGVHKRVFFFVR
jgi:hypothetical protein